MSYLESITLIKTLPCLAEPGKIIVIGNPSQTLDGVLPYLATLPGVIAGIQTPWLSRIDARMAS